MNSLNKTKLKKMAQYDPFIIINDYGIHQKYRRVNIRSIWYELFSWTVERSSQVSYFHTESHDKEELKIAILEFDAKIYKMVLEETLRAVELAHKNLKDLSSTNLNFLLRGVESNHKL